MASRRGRKRTRSLRIVRGVRANGWRIQERVVMGDLLPEGVGPRYLGRATTRAGRPCAREPSTIGSPGPAVGSERWSRSAPAAESCRAVSGPRGDRPEGLSERAGDSDSAVAAPIGVSAVDGLRLVAGEGAVADRQRAGVGAAVLDAAASHAGDVVGKGPTTRCCCDVYYAGIIV